MHVQAERIQDLEAEVRHTREAGESADESHKADEDTLKPSGSRMSIYFTVHEGAGGQTSRAAGHLMEREQKILLNDLIRLFPTMVIIEIDGLIDVDLANVDMTLANLKEKHYKVI